MRGSSKKITICEVLREINDLHQNDSEHDRTIRKKLMIAEEMAKKMSKKLFEYSKTKNFAWWKNNPDYEKNMKKRLAKNYLAD
jgi:hypothetical protein